MLAPVSAILLDRARGGPGEHVLDVGCGCGATSRALADKVGPTGHVLGIDISAPMLQRARQLTPSGIPVEFLLADATVHPFEPATSDLIASRFGVMFFAEPAASFANLRKALRSGGQLTFACWRTAPQPVADDAATSRLPACSEAAATRTGRPGPFSFAPEARVHRILGEAGFSGIAMEACDLTLDVAIGRGLDAAVESALQIGPASRALDGQPADVIAAAATSIREALAPFVTGQAVVLPASIWIVSARNL